MNYSVLAEVRVTVKRNPSGNVFVLNTVLSNYDESNDDNFSLIKVKISHTFRFV